MVQHGLADAVTEVSPWGETCGLASANTLRQPATLVVRQDWTQLREVQLIRLQARPDHFYTEGLPRWCF